MTTLNSDRAEQTLAGLQRQPVDCSDQSAGRVVQIGLFTAAAAGSVIIVGGFGLLSLFLVAGLLALGAGFAVVSIMQDRRTEARHAARITGIAEARCEHAARCITGLDKLLDGVLPIWSGQIELARSHTEEAAIALAGRWRHFQPPRDCGLVVSRPDLGTTVEIRIPNETPRAEPDLFDDDAR